MLRCGPLTRAPTRADWALVVVGPVLAIGVAAALVDCMKANPNSLGGLQARAAEVGDDAVPVGCIASVAAAGLPSAAGHPRWVVRTVRLC
jgi:hypothetical protein